MALAACSKSGSSSTKSDSPTASLLAFFPPDSYMTVGAVQRLAFGVADAGGTLDTNSPAKLSFTISDPKGTKTTVEVTAHNEGLPWSYYPVPYTPTEAGNHTATTTVGGETVSAAFAVGAKGSSKVPGPGDKMPTLTTPTNENTLDVDPICTQDPPCNYHATSLDVALEGKRPTAYLIATPKFCQSGICGPVLEVMEAVGSTYGGQIALIHQEVYQSATEAAENGANATLTKALLDLNVTSEPVLFLIGRDGVIRQRLDAAFDKKELRAGFDGLLD